MNIAKINKTSFWTLDIVNMIPTSSWMLYASCTKNSEYQTSSVIIAGNTSNPSNPSMHAALQYSITSSCNFVLSTIAFIYYNDNKVANEPIIVIKISKSIMDIRKPVTASPRGLLNIPMNERRKPKNHTNHPIPGTQEKINDKSESTKPAVPTPLD